MAHAAYWSWETFLLPLSDAGDDLKPQSSSRNVTAISPVYIPPSLVQRFTSNLEEQHNQKTEEKNLQVAVAEEGLKSLFPFDFNLWELRAKWKNYEKALNIKSDRDSPGSAWNIAMLEKYINHEDLIFIKPRIPWTGAVMGQTILDKVALSLTAICGTARGIDGNFIQFHEMLNSTEADSRMVLEAILQPLCAYKGLALRSEQTITCSFLPNNRFDYIMYYNDQPIGVVEAKRQRCLKDQSVAQLLVQLLLLAAENSGLLYFGVLSDAYRFIFAGVSRNKVLFFQNTVTPIELTTLQSSANLLSIAGKISWLIDLAINSRVKRKSIEDYLIMHFNGFGCFEVGDAFFFDNFPFSNSVGINIFQ